LHNQIRVSKHVYIPCPQVSLKLKPMQQGIVLDLLISASKL
jgi:hypothetical protein